MKKFLTIIFFFLIILLSTAIASVQKIAIVPFVLYAPPELQYLKDGIYTMFATRLFWENKVEVIEKEELRKTLQKLELKGISSIQQAQRLGQALEADYVLYGSVTVLGEGASIDLKLFDVNNQKIHPFFAQCLNLNELISKIDALAANINNTIFGREIVITQTPQSPPSLTTSPTIQEKPSLSHQTKPSQIKLKEWYSYPMPLEAKGLAIGDIDGDGNNEIVLIDSNNIWVYRFENKRLFLIKKKEGTASDHFINVDLCDLNNDGKEELLISNIIRKQVKSIVYTWQNNQLEVLIKNIPWYLKVQYFPDGKKIILGQRKGLDTLFETGIYQLVWNGKEFEIKERMCNFRNISVYNCLFADVTGDGLENIFLLDEEDYLVLFTKTGSKEWKSGEHYDGSFYYVEGNPIDEDTFNPRLERIYIPGRMLLIKFNPNSPYEVFAYLNHARFGHIIKDYKSFKSGEIRLLAWDGLGMKIKWKSPEISGCITDCIIGDYDNDGEKEFVFATVRRRETKLLTKARSIIIAYNLKAIQIEVTK